MADARSKQLEQLKQLCLEAEQLRDAALRLCADLGEQLSRVHTPESPEHRSERRRQDRRISSVERRRPSERRSRVRRATPD